MSESVPEKKSPKKKKSAAKKKKKGEDADAAGVPGTGPLTAEEPTGAGTTQGPGAPLGNPDDRTVLEGGPDVKNSPGLSKPVKLDTADRYSTGALALGTPPPGVPSETLIRVPISHEGGGGGASTVGWRVFVKNLDEAVMRTLVDANPALQWSPKYMKGVGREATVLDESPEEQVVKLAFTGPAAVGWFPLNALQFLGKPGEDVVRAPQQQQQFIQQQHHTQRPASPQRAPAHHHHHHHHHQPRSTSPVTSPAWAPFVSRPQPAYPPGYTAAHASPSPPRFRPGSPRKAVPAHYAPGTFQTPPAPVPGVRPPAPAAPTAAGAPHYALIPQAGGYVPVALVPSTVAPSSPSALPASSPVRAPSPPPKYRMQVGDYVVKKIALNGDVGVVIGRDDSEEEPILVRWMDRATKMTRRTDVYGDGELRKIDDFKLTEDLFAKAPVEEQMDVIFRFYDANADGHWSLEELNKCLKDAGLDALTPEQFRAACREIGCNPHVGLLKADVRIFVFHGRSESIAAVYRTIRRHIREQRAQEESPLAALSIERSAQAAQNDREREYWSSPGRWNRSVASEAAPHPPRLQSGALNFSRLAGSPYSGTGYRGVKL